MHDALHAVLVHALSPSVRSRVVSCDNLDLSQSILLTEHPVNYPLAKLLKTTELLTRTQVGLLKGT